MKKHLRGVSFSRVRILNIFIVLFLLVSSAANGQWSYSIPIRIDNNANPLLVNYQVPIYVNTASLVSAGYMQSDGRDIRFSSDCSMSKLYSYYIDSGMNSSMTKIWIRIDSLKAASSQVVYMFYGNSGASAASTLATFFGPFSATDSVASGSAGGVGNSQRGFRFSPNSTIIVTEFGKREPTGTTRYVTLFDYSTQGVVQQSQVSGSAGTYTYGPLASPIWLNKNQQYILELYQGSSDGYYFGNSSQINSALTYYDMRYCNSCTQTTFPTNTLSNYHYGYPDFHFYTLDTNTNITATPTYYVGDTNYVTIINQPSGANLCDGDIVNFGITATGAAAYQWQINTGSGWVNLSDTGVISGSTSNYVHVSAVNPSMNGYYFRCNAIGACGKTVTSNAVNIVVSTPAVVTTQPDSTNMAACLGGMISASTYSSGAGNYYIWEENSGSGWHTLSGVNVATNYVALTATTSYSQMIISNITSAYSGRMYRCIVQNYCATIDTTNVVTATINTPASIVSNPSSVTICEGSNTSFTMGLSTTTGITYQWMVNSGAGYANVPASAPYSNTTSATLNITAATASMNGYKFICKAIDQCNDTLISDTVTLNINTAPAITSQPGNVLACSGSGAAFTPGATGTNLSYHWQINTGSGFSNLTITSPYSLNTSGELTISSVTTAMSGYIYRCIISGTCSPSVTTNEDTLTVTTLPHIVSTKNDTVCSGSTAHLVATNSPTGLTVWYAASNGGSSVAFGDTLTLPGVTTNATYYAQSVTALGNLFTTYAGGNRQDGIMYDVHAKRNIIVTGFDVMPNQSGTFNFQIYYKTGTHVGSEYTPANWTLLASSVVSGTAGIALSIPVNLQLSLSANNDYAFYIVSSNPGIYINYTNGTAIGNVYAQNVDLQIKEGQGSQGIFGVGGGFFSPRVFNGVIRYQSCTDGLYVPVTLKVNQLPAITSSPANSTICEGANTSFSVTATGTDSTYQWQVDNGSGFANVINNSIYSGATTATLSLTNPAPAYNSYQYRCVVGGICTPSLTSTAATLTINSIPRATTQPSSSTICLGSNASFTYNATGTGLSYQWYENTGSGFVALSDGGVYSGSATSTLSFTTPPTTLSGNLYKCIVTGTCTPVITSDTVKLTVNSPVTLSASPADQSVCVGSNTSFTVAATGTSISYQWQVDNGSGFANLSDTTGIYSGSTTTSLTLTNVIAAKNGYKYRCVLTGVCGPIVNTTTATLTVNTIPAIVSQPTNKTICFGNNTSFSFTGTGSGLTYQWYVNTGSGFTALSDGGVYSGSSTGTLTLTAPPATMSGYIYRCIGTAICAPTLTSNSVTLTVNTSPSITTQPVAATTICQGGSATFAVTATGTSLVYQWQFSGNNGVTWTNITTVPPFSNPNTATLTITNGQYYLNGSQYRCVISGTCSPSVTSNLARLTVNQLPYININPSDAVTCAGSNASMTVAAVGTGITYQWEVNTGSGFTAITNNATYSGATTATLTMSSVPATMNGYRYHCIVSGICSPSVTSTTQVLHVNTPPVVTTQPSDKAVCAGGVTQFTIGVSGQAYPSFTYQWQVDDGSGYVNLSNNSTYSGVTTGALTVTANIPLYNNKYRCIVSTGCAPNVTSNDATLTMYDLPMIVNVSKSGPAMLCPKSVVTFNVAAIGSGLNYQWQVNMGAGFVNVPNTPQYQGQTNPLLKIMSVSSNMNGYLFRCVVGGTCSPSVTSQALTLGVYDPVGIASQPLTDTVCENANTSLSIGAYGGGLLYQWQIKESNGSYTNIANIPPYSGANTATLTFTNTPGTADGTIYRCMVTETVFCHQTVYTTDIPVKVNLKPVALPVKEVAPFFGSVTFTVPNTATEYQWQENHNNTGFTDLQETPPYSGTQTNVLTISPVGFDMSENTYRCVVKGTACAPLTTTSTVSTLIVDPALSVNSVTGNEKNTLSVYPNPVADAKLNISFSNPIHGKTDIRVLNKMGQVVKIVTVDFINARATTIDVSGLAAGVYTLQVVNLSEQISASTLFTKQ